MEVTHGRGYVYSIQYHIVWCVKYRHKIRKESDVKPVEKAYKYRIYPNKKQKEIIAKTFGCCRFIYIISILQSELKCMNRIKKHFHMFNVQMI